MSSLFTLPSYDPTNPGSAAQASATGDVVRQTIETVYTREGGALGNSKRAVFQIEPSGSRYLDLARSYFTLKTTVADRTLAAGPLTRVDPAKAVRLAPNYAAAVFSKCSLYLNDSLAESIDHPAELAAYELRTARGKDWHEAHAEELAWPTDDNVGVQKIEATSITAGAVVADAVALNAAGNAGAFAVARDELDVSGNTGKTTRTIVFRPPMSMWNSQHLLPAAKARLEMNFHQSALQRLIQSTGTVAAINTDAATAAGTVSTNIDALEFHAVMLEGGDSAAASSYNGSYMLPLRKVECLKNSVLTAKGVLRVTVPPSTFRLSMAWQDKRTDLADSNVPAAYFTPGLSAGYTPTPGDSVESYGLTRWQLQYAGNSLPVQPAELAFSERADADAGPTEDNMLEHYTQHVLAIGADDISVETYNEWRRRGAIFTYSVPKPEIDNSTEVTLNYDFTGNWATTDQATGVQNMLFATSMASLAIQVEGGVVTRVVRNEN
jgi:hypothetical protein